MVYIGMTNGFTGTVGRANGHFKRGGTLRKQFLNHKGYDLNSVDDLVLLSFPLPQKAEYNTVERSYREAVEYLVQKDLQLKRGSVNPSFDVVSWVRNSPSTGNREVIRIAQDIVYNFLNSYNTI